MGNFRFLPGRPRDRLESLCTEEAVAAKLPRDDVESRRLDDVGDRLYGLAYSEAEGDDMTADGFDLLADDADDDRLGGEGRDAWLVTLPPLLRRLEEDEDDDFFRADGGGGMLSSAARAAASSSRLTFAVGYVWVDGFSSV